MNTDQNTDPGAARVAAWTARARSAGHPVLEICPGWFAPRPVPVAVAGMAPNDVLDIARERQRARVAWVHVFLPTAGDLLALGEALRAPVTRPARPGLLARLGARRPRLGATGGTPVGPVAVSQTRGGVTAHVLEVPVSWLDRPVTVVCRPQRPAPATAPVVVRG